MRRSLPSLNALRAFEVAARHASFRAAGKELCVSHSAISHQVKLLEQYLGLELFTRNPRTVELTEAGGALYPVLRDAFDKIADCTDMLLAPRQQNVLTVRLYSTLAVRWLIPRLPKFQMAHPEIKFRLNSSQWDVDFDREAVDCCIMIGHRSNEALHYDYLFSSELFPVCSPELREAPFPLNQPDDLARCTILQVYPSCRDWRFWLERWQIDNVDPDSGLQFDSYDHALATARAGLGVAMGMQPYLAADLHAGRLVEIFPGKRVLYDREWYFACRKERTGEHKITAFRDWLLNEVSADPDIEDLADRPILRRFA